MYQCHTTVRSCVLQVIKSICYRHCVGLSISYMLLILLITLYDICVSIVDKALT